MKKQNISLVENNGSERTESEKTQKLAEKLDETHRQLEELDSDERKLLNEDILIQENEWLKARLEEKRQEENRAREELFERQKMLEGRRRERGEGLEQSRQMQLYRQMHENEQRDMIYSIHGVSVDKEEGMKEYKNALYQGSQIILFVVDIAFCTAVAFIYGTDSKLFLSFVALMAAQTTLLPREHKGKLGRSPYSVISMILSFLPTPAMAGLILTEELKLYPMEDMLFYSAIFAAVISFVGALDYFDRNPYREAQKAAREAVADIKELKKTAAKTVKKNEKARLRLEKKLLRNKEAQEAKLKKLREKEEARYELVKKREEEKAEKLKEKLEAQEKNRQKNLELKALRDENRKRNVEICRSKISEFRSKIAIPKITAENEHIEESAVKAENVQTEEHVLTEEDGKTEEYPAITQEIDENLRDVALDDEESCESEVS